MDADAKNSNCGRDSGRGRVDQVAAPLYLKLADEAKHMRELGMSDKAIARALGVSDKTVAKAIERARDP